MAKIRKRGGAYQIDYVDPGGKRVRLSFKRKKDAEAELGKRVSLIAEHRYLDVKKDYKTTLSELIKKYEENFGAQRSFDRWKAFCLKNFEDYFRPETTLSNIRYVDVETYQNHLREKITRQNTVRANSSINREISCLRHLFRKAVEWEMMERSPFDRGKSLLLKENNARLRFLTEDEVKRLLDACSSHLRDIVICALNTGMRRGEILSLKWSQIRNGLIYLEQTKTDEPRQVPINEELARLFQEIRRKQKVGTEHVFTYSRVNPMKGKPAGTPVLNVLEGNPVSYIKTAFWAALRRAGIVNFKFHDLRHTFASHMVMRGASLKEVQEILGHKTMTMTLRYAHLSQEHKKKAVNLLNGLTTSEKPDLSQNVTKAVK